MDNTNEISKVKIDNKVYDLKDEELRRRLAKLIGDNYTENTEETN